MILISLNQKNDIFFYDHEICALYFLIDENMRCIIKFYQVLYTSLLFQEFFFINYENLKFYLDKNDITV